MRSRPAWFYRDQNVKVTAFPVKHGWWKQAFGYRFDTSDRSVVLSGDTAPSEEVVKACNGCDVLLHEVYNVKGAEMREEHWQEYFAAFHTSPQQLGDIATRAHPKLLVLYHQVLEHLPEEDLLEQVRQSYTGEVVSAHDLGVY